jgi:3-deoxy-manno-octulosonate cytidylyltransferase (CMP-KDO synthetase)
MASAFKYYGIIPARYASTRLPGKMLADIGGRPMFWHVYARACRCVRLSGVILATDDDRIMHAARELDVPCLMTGKNLQSGTDRVYVAARMINAHDDDVIINIQGDEPELDPVMLDEITAPFSDKAVRVCTLAVEIDKQRAQSPNQVKVIVATNGDAIYFSRAVIPHMRDAGSFTYLGHAGVYAFRMKTLARFAALAPSPLEQAEKLEQLRLLENNIPVRVVKTERHTRGVDTQEDLNWVRTRIGAVSIT